MIESLFYVTSNDIKFQVAARVLTESGIALKQLELDIPEIQSCEVEEVARQSAIWASQRLAEPVAVTDAGFYIEALNGFPGPFIKYTNHWLSAADYLKLMYGRINRCVIIRECLAFCRPHEEPVVLSTAHEGRLAIKPGSSAGTAMDQIFIPAGRSIPISDIPPDEMIGYWSDGSIWRKLREYICSGHTAGAVAILQEGI